MWKPIVTDGIALSAIHQKLEQIYKAVTRFEMNEKYGLLTGYGSILLFLSQYYQYTKDPRQLDEFNQKFDSFYKSFYKDITASFSSGIAGVNWLIRHLCKTNILEVDDVDDILQDLDDISCQTLAYYAQTENFDYLHGGIGVAYYLSTVQTRDFTSQIKSYFQQLDCSKKSTSEKNACWLINTYVNSTSIGSVYNLSLSHGMAAFIPCFIKYLKKMDDASIKELLIKTINFFKDSVLPEESASYFPKWIEIGASKGLVSHLSWCYGDPGMAQAIYQAGKFLEDSEVQDMALEALTKASKRKNVEVEHIVEACFCHGSSSLLHVFNRMYQQTQKEEFRDTALYWLNDTLAKGSNKTPYAGYRFFDDGNPNSNFNLLSGLSGVGLALLAAIDSTEPTWDECVLLS
jgi:lantibiotic modifying enzyme